MRSASRECHTIDPQSVSSTSNRPPGRSTRNASPSAAGMSCTYSYTCVATAASNLSPANGSAQASPATNRISAAPSGGRRRAREREHALARVDAVDRAASAHLGRHLAGEESQPRPDVQHVLPLSERQGRAYRTTLLDDIRRHICRFGPPRSLLVELQRGAHPTIFSTSPGALNLTRRDDPRRLPKCSMLTHPELPEISLPRHADLALVPNDFRLHTILASAGLRLQPRAAANATLSRRADPRGQRQYLVGGDVFGVHGRQSRLTTGCLSTQTDAAWRADRRLTRACIAVLRHASTISHGIGAK